MNWKLTFRGTPPKTPTAIIFLISIIVLEMFTISLLWNPTLPLTVYIVRVYDVGDIGYWDVVCLNVTNHGNSPVYPIFLLYMFGSEKRWVVSVGDTPTPPAYAPYNCTLPVIPPHSSRLINISAPSPLYFIPPFTRIFVQVYSVGDTPLGGYPLKPPMLGYDFVNSPVYVTPNITRPPVLNPDFSVLYYSGKYNETLPWGWYIELVPGTKLSYHDGIVVNGTAIFYQPVFGNVTVTGYNISYVVSGNVLYIYVHNGYVRGVVIGS